MLEKDIERAFCEYAKKKGCIPYKFTSPARRSVPDRMIVGPNGLVIFIEFKAPGKKPTDAQDREISRLVALGHHVFVCDKKGQGELILDRLLKEYSDG